MTIQERYRRLTLWNKIAFWGSITSFAGLIPVIASTFSEPQPLPAVQRSLRITSEQENEFVRALKSVPESRESVRLGCAAADEQACVLAGNFFDIFHKAGWTVRTIGVERVRLSIPRGGVVLMKHGERTDPPPPGSGVWVLQTPSSLAVESAFHAIGLHTEKNADATMPEGVIGIFIGPTL